MKQYLGIIILFLFSCQNRLAKTVLDNNSTDTVKARKVIITSVKKNEIEEFFADSINIGKKSFNKVEISKYKSIDSIYVIIKFYSKQNNKWILKNNFHFVKDGITSCDPNITDFNNDGLNDITYKSAVAARGANEVRKLFIYDKTKDTFIYLKNSEDYPNMLFNKELNCIDAFLVHGSCSTTFLKIKGDSLKEFASVHLGNNLTIYEYNKKGEEIMIRQDTTNELEYIRFKNYNPLKEYDQQ
jgi:hypothetical protein